MGYRARKLSDLTQGGCSGQQPYLWASPSSAWTSHSCTLRFTIQQCICYPVENVNGAYWQTQTSCLQTTVWRLTRWRSQRGSIESQQERQTTQSRTAEKKKTTEVQKRAIALLCTFTQLQTHTILAILHRMIYRTQKKIKIEMWKRESEFQTNKTFLQCQEFNKHCCMEYSTWSKKKKGKKKRKRPKRQDFKDFWNRLPRLNTEESEENLPADHFKMHKWRNKYKKTFHRRDVFSLLLAWPLQYCVSNSCAMSGFHKVPACQTKPTACAVCS